MFSVDKVQFLHVACFGVIFHSENVKYTHLLEQALPFQNKQKYVASSSFGIWTFGQLYSVVLPSVGVLSLLWMGTAERRVQHCWVFYQMDTRYESGLSFSQESNVCVGLHIAYLETTQVP